MRTFIGFDIDDKFRRECEYLIMKGKKLYPKEIKWVEPINLHFTYLFLGEVDQSDVKIIGEMLSQLAEQVPIINLENGILKWNPPFKPQTIWMEYSLYNPDFAMVRKIFSKKLTEEIPYLKLDNKDFKFHLTLGRIKNKIDINKWLLHEEVINTNTTLTQISLYESILYPQGPVYKNINLIKLSGGNLV